MDRDDIRMQCLSFPGVTENVQWGDDLVFKVSGKMFTVVRIGPDELEFSFKCAPESFYELLERRGVRPAPYLARAQWVLVETPNDLRWAEVQTLLGEAYRIVCEKLPRGRRPQAAAASSDAPSPRRIAGRTPRPPKTATKTKKRAARN